MTGYIDYQQGIEGLYSQVCETTGRKLNKALINSKLYLAKRKEFLTQHIALTRITNEKDKTLLNTMRSQKKGNLHAKKLIVVTKLTQKEKIKFETEKEKLKKMI